MNSTIIITALVSVLLTLVIAYFIWSEIRVRKLTKKAKDNKKENKQLKKYLERLELNTEEQSNQIYGSIDDLRKEKNDDDRIISDCQEEMLDDVRKDVDRRFDKVYKAISENTQKKS